MQEIQATLQARVFAGQNLEKRQLKGALLG